MALLPRGGSRSWKSPSCRSSKPRADRWRFSARIEVIDHREQRQCARAAEEQRTDRDNVGRSGSKHVSRPFVETVTPRTFANPVPQPSFGMDVAIGRASPVAVAGFPSDAEP